MSYNFDDLMAGFGVVTVMDATLYKLAPGKSYVGKGACKHNNASGGALVPSDFVCSGLYLDTLKIANLTQEGPTKTITGGQYANPIIKYGKTMTCEMQDALGRAATMVEFFGCDYDAENNRLSVTDKFPGGFCLEGKTFFIDQKTGEKRWVYIFIPQFIPDAILSLTQDAEGDATVFDLNGSVAVTSIADSSGAASRDVFYEIRKTSWFEGMNAIADGTTNTNWHDDEATALDGAKEEAVETYKSYCVALGAEIDDAKITAINSANNEAAVKEALKTAMQSVQIPD